MWLEQHLRKRSVKRGRKKQRVYILLFFWGHGSPRSNPILFIYKIHKKEGWDKAIEGNIIFAHLVYYYYYYFFQNFQILYICIYIFTFKILNSIKN